MTPATIDYEIIQGSDFTRRITWEVIGEDGHTRPVQLRGAKARMQIRRRHSSPIVELDLEHEGYIGVADPDNGIIQVDIPAAATAALTFRTAVYDIEVVFDDGRVVRIVEGTLTLSPEVTREGA